MISRTLRPKKCCMPLRASFPYPSMPCQGNGLRTVFAYHWTRHMAPLAIPVVRYRIGYRIYQDICKSFFKKLNSHGERRMVRKTKQQKLQRCARNCQLGECWFKGHPMQHHVAPLIHCKSVMVLLPVVSGSCFFSQSFCNFDRSFSHCSRSSCHPGWNPKRLRHADMKIGGSSIISQAYRLNRWMNLFFTRCYKYSGFLVTNLVSATRIAGCKMTAK